jgi:hypothetical protein
MLKHTKCFICLEAHKYVVKSIKYAWDWQTKSELEVASERKRIEIMNFNFNILLLRKMKKEMIWNISHKKSFVTVCV